MSELVICEKCGSEMKNFQEFGSCGMTCPNCGWGWATTYISPIDLDDTEYTIIVEKSENFDISILQCISKVFGHNYLESRKILKTIGFSKSGSARDIQEYAIALHKAGIVFSISPDFPYNQE